MPSIYRKFFNRFSAIQISNILQLGSLCMFGIITITLLLPGLLRLPLHIHINYNEGWNAFHTRDVMMGKPLYTTNIFTPVNYPPLSFYIIGALAFVFGDPLFVGRIVALLSLISIAGLVSYLIFWETRHWYASIFTGLLVLSFFGLLGADYIGMDDPQLLGNFFLVVGLLSYVRFKNLFFASLFMVFAVFIKDSILALPIAMTCYLLITDKKQFVRWVLYGFLLFGSMLIIVQILSHNLFLVSLLTGRRYLIANFISLIKTQLLPVIVLLGLGVFFSKKKNIFWLYLITSVCCGLFFSLGSGTGINMYFDTYIALSLVLGIIVAEFRNIRKVVIIGIIFLNIATGFGLKVIFHRLQLNPVPIAASEQKDIKFIMQFQGNVLCEYIDYCYYAGKDFVYDPFLVNELIVEKKIPESQLVQLLNEKKFSLIELTNRVDIHYFNHLPLTTLTSIKNERFTENFYRALGNNYHPVGQSDNVSFYAPNDLLSRNVQTIDGLL